MKKYITISQLAQLMNVSVHQLRYFEEKGILYPLYTDENQYRMYGLHEIYQLSHILMLRKLNIPVGQIEECMTSYTADDYNQLLEHSLQKVQDEIANLKLLEQFIHKVLKEHHTLTQQNNEYRLKLQGTRHLKLWFALESDQELTARNLFEQRPAPPQLFENDLHYLSDSGQVKLYYETTSGTADYILEEGTYLYKHFSATEDAEIEHQVQQLEHYATQHQYECLSKIIVVEKSYLSIFDSNELQYEIQVQISDSRRTLHESTIL
ncbi:helix-turn-helix domain-containing protein [Paenibacillus polymyxa]|uniref:helix-turn-helix domain-containing protein n=1 Tax=Paenibacillus polymyxa TaxID=1406 RepID=UPI0008C4D298|nr:MerR family transcriptional regulator [Paenibacillus polymyxa]SEI73172.1 DNA-binding transcriptional regulator, MerR family [Paenibacillus polymyxa]